MLFEGEKRGSALGLDRGDRRGRDATDPLDFKEPGQRKGASEEQKRVSDAPTALQEEAKGGGTVSGKTLARRRP